MIDKLEAELIKVEAAQKGYDRFPNAHYAWATPKPHGPKSKEQHEKFIAEEERIEELKNKELDKHFPFLQQLFIGPKTKMQARYDKIAREDLADGYLEDLEHLLEPENFDIFMAWLAGGQKPMKIVHGPPPGPPAKKGGDPKAGAPAAKDGKAGPPLRMRKMTFDEKRCAREKAKIEADLRAKEEVAKAKDKEKVKVQSKEKAKDDDRDGGRQREKERDVREKERDQRERDRGRREDRRPIGPPMDNPACRRSDAYTRIRSLGHTAQRPIDSVATQPP